MTGADPIVAIDVGTQSVRAIVFDPRGDARRARAASRSSRTSRPTRLGRAGPGALLAVHRRGLRRRCSPTRRSAATAIAGVDADDPARRRSCVTDAAGDAAPPGDRLARPAPGRGPAAGRRRDGHSLFRAARRARHGRRASQADCEANWLRDARARRRGRGPPATSACPGFLTHRLTGRWVDSTPPRSATCRSTTSASRWAAPGDWKWTVAPVEPALAARARAADRPARRPQRGRGRATRAAGRPAGDRGGRRQGVRGPRLGRARRRTSAACRTARPRPLNMTSAALRRGRSR